MKKRILLPISAALLAALMLVGCSKQDPNAPDGYQIASNDKVDYTLFVPNDWTVDTDSDSLMTAARASEQESANITMMEYDNSEYAIETAEDGKIVSPVPTYWEDKLDDLKKLFDVDEEGNSTFKLESSETSLIGSSKLAAYTYIYTGTIDGLELKYMQVIAYRGGDKDSFCFFTYTAPASRYDEYVDDVKGILENIVFD